MSRDQRHQQIKQYHDRIAQLEYENQMLRSYTVYRPPPHDPQTLSIVELASRNERLERETEMYQREIKRELTNFIRESNIIHDCNFKQKYVNSLAYPPSKHLSFRRI